LVETPGKACVKSGWQVHADVLMPDHFHLVVETPRANRVTGMGRLRGEYGILGDSPAGRGQLERALEARRAVAEKEAFKGARRGWCLGEAAFRRELLA
jgi:REP element-mobilizing transposase RayT